MVLSVRPADGFCLIGLFSLPRLERLILKFLNKAVNKYSKLYTIMYWELINA
jgi:hypothetical protein